MAQGRERSRFETHFKIGCANTNEPMTDKEYEELERRIAERNRIKAMVADMDECEKERRAETASNEARFRYSGGLLFGDAGGSNGKSRLAGDSFIHEQIRTD